MKTVDLTVRQCPSDIHAALARRAEKKNTSLRVETIATLRAALGTETRMNEAALRKRINEIPSRARLTLAETQEAVREGRR